MFTIQAVTNLKWCNAEHTVFYCDVKYVEFNEVHPTGVNATDPYAHIQELWVKGNAGVYGAISEYALPSLEVKPIVGNQPNTTGSQDL